MRRILIILLMLCLSLPLLTACGDPAEVLTEGDFEIRIYTDADGVAKTVKTYRGGKMIDTWRPRGQVSYAEAPIRFVDVNFDGYTDMRMLSATGDHLRYANRIYSPDTDSFYTSTVLDLLKDPVIDTEAKLITAYYSKYTVEPAVGMTPEVYIDERGTKTCAWINNNLTVIARDCITYYSESDIYCVARWEIDEDGDMEATQERWLMPDQLEKAGYTPFD